MGDDIDIEEHNIFDNPQLRKIFPDIEKLKRELDEDAPSIASETQGFLQSKQNGVDKVINGNPAEPRNTSQYSDDNISKNINELSDTDKTAHQNVDIQMDLDICSNVLLDVGKEDQFIYKSDVCKIVLKKEILICNVCSKESEEEMCKQCVLESAEGGAHCIESKKSLACDITPYASFEKSYLEQHILKHTGDISPKCNFKTQRSFKKHRNRKRNRFLCDICEYKTSTKSFLIIHRRKHTGEKPFKCGLCEFRCSQRGSLTMHLKGVHTKERKYSCDMCEYKSITKWHMTEHLRKHTGEKPFKCDLCDYTSSKRSSIKIHTKTKHTKEKNYPCNICEYKFVAKSYLDRHLRTHTGEKPYKCDLCDYASSQSGHLKDHIRARHTDEKNYICAICEYKSVTKGQLIKHIRKHTGEKQK